MKKIILAGLMLLFNTYIFGEEVDRIIVKKSESTLYLMKNKKILKEYKVSFGENPKGHKEKEGDEKTPEGNYTLDYKNSKSKFYKSIHISYPNEKDKQKAKKIKVSAGGDIMIHGQKNGFGILYFVTRWFNWTDGCIAVSNSEMNEIWKLVKVGTPIEIRE